MRQTWQDLLFAHWPVPQELLRPLIPDGLEVQSFDGSAWVGITPFRMSGVTLRLLPDLPWISAFPELNVRTYVERGGRAGIWFLSLDAGNALAVWAARRFFHLPYHRAHIQVRSQGEAIDYPLRRLGKGDAPAFAATYRPVSDAYESVPGTLEHWLTERYCLYAQCRRGRLYRAEVHHVPWPLQAASCEIRVNTMLRPHGLEVKQPVPLLHFARRLDVVVWPPEQVS